MKYFSFYLPQFHEIPENNDAWGNGFTEWVNVKKAKKLYDWQNQPRVPLGKNYYNLLDIDTLINQADIANKYGIDGFVFYHYWFNGRLVLEKPVELLKENSNIPLNFCFCWANEPWTKTWHGAGGNKEILIPQTYGGVSEWEKHYNYFRDYFKDERYVLIGNKPVILIYKLRNIPNFNQMIRYWNERAVSDGFEGIYLVSMNVANDRVHMSKWVNASVDFEPNRTKYEMLSNSVDENVIDYDEIYNKMLNVSHEMDHFRTVFVDYDDTPRRQERGVLCRNVTPEAFEKYLRASTQKSIEEGNDYIFINAWNEWGEGNYLEPDECNKFAFLEKVLKVKHELNGNNV